MDWNRTWVAANTRKSEYIRQKQMLTWMNLALHHVTIHWE